METDSAFIYDYVDLGTAKLIPENMHVSTLGVEPEEVYLDVLLTEKGRLGFNKDSIKSLGVVAVPEALLWLPRGLVMDTSARSISHNTSFVSAVIASQYEVSKTFDMPTIVTPSQDTAIRLPDMCKQIDNENISKPDFSLWLLTKNNEVADTDDEVVKVGDLHIDTTMYEVRNAETSQATHFTKKEFDLLVLLAKKQGTVVSKEDAMLEVWERYHYDGDRTLDTYIKKIRRKLESIDCNDYIQTITGRGHVIKLPELPETQ